jgi:hypothetical protein
MWWHSEFRQPAQLLGKVTDVENMNYSQALFVQPGLS